ncbi:hypothetical protein BT93_J1563 [Corymbia citriodora subsp. variegata]|nr:hypothetical protein BT93_J1563 [Corymbia citriodora subsp. variegata]
MHPITPPAIKAGVSGTTAQPTASHVSRLPPEFGPQNRRSKQAEVRLLCNARDSERRAGGVQAWRNARASELCRFLPRISCFCSDLVLEVLPLQWRIQLMDWKSLLNFGFFSFPPCVCVLAGAGFSFDLTV